MQLTTLQVMIQIESENRDLTSSKIGTNHDITVIEQKISELQVKYKQKKQKLEQ